MRVARHALASGKTPTESTYLAPGDYLQNHTSRACHWARAVGSWRTITPCRRRVQVLRSRKTSGHRDFIPGRGARMLIIDGETGIDSIIQGVGLSPKG